MALTDRQFTALLRRAQCAARTHKQIQGEITSAFEDRYGRTHSDIDCDVLIDALDYGDGSGLTAKIADREMASAGQHKIER